MYYLENPLLKIVFRISVQDCSGSVCLMKHPVASIFEYRSVHSSFVGVKFIDYLSDYQLLKTETAP